MASSQDQIAFAEGYKFVVGEGRYAVYTTTRQEALREAERLGDTAYALRDEQDEQTQPKGFLHKLLGRKRNPADGSMRQHNYLNPFDSAWCEQAYYKLELVIKANGEVYIYGNGGFSAKDLNDALKLVFGTGNYTFNTDGDSEDYNYRQYLAIPLTTTTQLQEFLRRIAKTEEYKLAQVDGSLQSLPDLTPSEKEVFSAKLQEHDLEHSSVVAEFETHAYSGRTTAKIYLPKGIAPKAEMVFSKLFYPRKRTSCATHNYSTGRKTFELNSHELEDVADWAWKQAVNTAKTQYGVHVIIKGTPPFKSTEKSKEAALSFEEKLAANAGQWAGRHIVLTFDGQFYLVTGAPDVDFTTTLLGRGVDGVGLAQHKRDCPGSEVILDEEATAEARKQAKKAGMEPKQRRQIVITKTRICKACTNKVPRGVWFTTEAEKAAKLRSLADGKAVSALDAEQKKLNEQYEQAVQRKAQAKTLIAWSSAKQPLPNMGDPKSIPCPPAYIDHEGKRIPLAYTPYQLAGIMYVNKQNKTLLADEMGVGKTAQALGVINCNPDMRKILILAPGLALFNWKEEAERWLIKCNPLSTPKEKDRLKIAVMEETDIPDAKANIVICNYEKLAGNKDKATKLRNWALAQKWDLLIADECHYCKLRADSTRDTISKRALALYGWPAEDTDPELKGLVHSAKKVILMTGTPIPNRPIEIWPLANFLAPGEFGDRFAFGKKFCDLHKETSGGTRVPDNYVEGGGGGARWVWKGAGQAHSNGTFVKQTMGELQVLLRSYGMIRRTKKEVLDLPPKDREIVSLEPNDEIERALQAELEALAEENETEIFDVASQVEALRQAWRDNQEKAQKILDEMSTYEEGSADRMCLEQELIDLGGEVKTPFKAISKTRHRMGTAKCGPALKYIDALMVEKDLKKIIVFAYHEDVVNRIVDYYRNKYKQFGKDAVAVINGKMTARKKQAAKDLFQRNPDCRVFVGQIASSNTAITLTQSDHVVFVEQDWVPGTMQQAEDRAHRLGQKGKAVWIKYLIVEGSIDGTMASTVLNKRDIQQRALDRPPEEGDIDTAFAAAENGPVVLDTDDGGVLVGLLAPVADAQPTLDIAPPDEAVQVAVQAELGIKPPKPVKRPAGELPVSVPHASVDALVEKLQAEGITSIKAATNSATRIAKTINERVFDDILLVRNQKSRKVFEDWTGIKLPATDKATKAVLVAWAKLRDKPPKPVAVPVAVPAAVPVKPPTVRPVLVAVPVRPPIAEPVALQGAPTLARCIKALEAAGLTPDSAKKVGVPLHRVFTELEYNAALAPNNPRCRKTFEKLAGITLPADLEGTQKAVAKWARQRRKAAEQVHAPAQVHAPVRPPVVSVASTPAPVRVPTPAVVAKPSQVSDPAYAKQVHAALQAVVQSGAPVTPIARALSRMASLNTDAQVQVALQSVRPHMAKLPAKLQVNPRRTRRKR